MKRLMNASSYNRVALQCNSPKGATRTFLATGVPRLDERAKPLGSMSRARRNAELFIYFFAALITYIYPGRGGCIPFE